ncbi:blue (type 1) copper domain-containing protein [Haloterrigena salina JCM 13891]|uniref:Blue (Type 1) copper domain-containing protein n=1 Tax=Haloterrigena salina JCM 13891 TaxID=1227488 RepID=M0BWF7_9EURY|nr:plastocyanin/azurin family copper-binding protein [Haloterrigena salina]ELZ15300.1 blue (type 1) copper domain-containing protein [Haloterrigena salina JCM 13891]
MTNEQRSREDVSRRGVLKGTAALAGTAALTGRAGAYRDVVDYPLPAAQGDVEGRTLSLLGIVGGWVGVAPAEIDGASNPPLRLMEGVENEIIWTNGDGSRHNFTIGDDQDEVIEATEFVEEQGESTSLTITPEEGMAQYYCIPHPVQMRGPIELVDPGEVHELSVRVEDENGDPLGAEVFVGDHHSFSNVVARGGPDQEGQSGESQELEPGDDEGGNQTASNETVGNETAGNETVGNETAGNETAGNETASDGVQEEETPADEDAPAIARFDMLEDGEYDLEVWTYGHERVTDTVTIDGEDQEITVTLPATDPGEPTETFSMRLEEGQWVGQEPEAIADQTNPTLELEADETYAIEWENGIGRHQPEGENRVFEPLPGHNFVIASGGDTNEWNTYVRSNFLSEEGETQTVEFVANEEMGVYLDQSQLDAVGEIAIGGAANGEAVPAGDETAGNETDSNETAEGIGNETAGNETVDNETIEAAGNETEGNETLETPGNETGDDD